MAEAPAPTSPSSGAPPDNQAKWLATSDHNMIQARNLTSMMLSVVRNNEIVEAANKDASMESAKREREVAKAKVYNQARAHEAVISVSFKCIQDIEDAILQTEDSLTKLTHERYKGFANLQVCERRQELREKRPLGETFKDALTDALADERKDLEKARKELFEMEGSGKQIIADMLSKRSFLSHDTGERRLLMMHDISTLKPQLGNDAPGASHGASHGASQNVPVTEANNQPPAEGAPPAAPAPPPVAQSEEQKKAEKESKELIQSTLKLLERAAQHRHKTLDLVFKVKQDRDRSCQRTEDAMARRTTELAEMKKMLEKHALDVEAAILRAERALERTERRLDKGNKAKMDKFAQDKTLLDQLRAARKKLQDDIRNKFAALEIDNMCRRVTAAKASEAKMKQALVRTNSAPSLGRKHKEMGSTFGDTHTSMEGFDSQESTRPPSTANKALHSPGGSKSLKAGAAAGLQQSS